MSIKLFNKIHCTEHDKLDLLVVGVTLTDYAWLIGDIVFGGLHPHHPFIFVSLGFFSYLSVLSMIRLIKRHDKVIRHKKERKAREDEYVPQSKQSEK